MAVIRPSTARDAMTAAAAHHTIVAGSVAVQGSRDELRPHIVPFTLGTGTRLFEGVPPLKLEQVASRSATAVTHVTYRVLS